MQEPLINDRSMDIELISNERRDINIFVKEFKWIETWLVYFPMWVNHINNYKQRRKCLSISVISFTSIVVLYHFAFIFKLIYDSIGDDGINMYHIVYFAAEILLTITRFISMYYFYKYFKYPLTSKATMLHFETNIYTKHAQKIRKWNKSFITLSVILGVSDVIVVYNYYQQNLLLTGNDVIYTNIALILGRLFVYWPLNICIILSCAIFLKYYLYILELTEIVQKEKEQNCISFDVLYDKYREMKKGFNHGYHSYFRLSIQLYLFTFILDIWVTVYQKNLWDYVEVAGQILQVSLYLLTASLITDTFQKFDKLIWNYCEETVKIKQQNQQIYDHNFVLNYILKYPFVIRMGNVRISKRNGIKFMIVFSVSKFIAYSLRYLVPYG